MLKVSNIEVSGFKTAIRGMRNPLKSWDKSDTQITISETNVSEEACQKYFNSLFSAMGSNNQNFTDKEKKNIEEEVKLQIEKSRLPGYENTGCSLYCVLGKDDLKLAQRLIKNGSDHSKFMRQIYVGMDITAPIYWWKEASTYKVATTANSESTMHTLTKEPITLDMFSFDGMAPEGEGKDWVCDLITIVHLCETYRKKFLEISNMKC